MRLKTTVLAAALVLCNGVAFAEDVTDTEVTLTNSGGYWTGGFEVRHSQTGAFNDIITFNPAAVGNTSSALFTIGFTPQSNIDFYSATLYTLGNPGGVPLILTPIMGGIVESGFSFPALLTGPFRLAVSGTAGSASTYTGTLNISPVPEPETYAMFGVGLGVVGLLARRRSKKGVARSYGSMATAA